MTALRLLTIAQVLNDQAAARGWRRCGFLTDHRKPAGWRSVSRHVDGMLVRFSPHGLDEDGVVCTMVAGVLAANGCGEDRARQEMLVTLLEAGEL